MKTKNKDERRFENNEYSLTEHSDFFYNFF